MSEELEYRLQDGFTTEGYIKDQNCFSSVRYRTMTANLNGCGWVAAYNIRHYLGHSVGWRDVCNELDSMHRLRVPGPTLMRVMRAYWDRWIPGWKETVGREQALAAAESSTCGIFRYHEKRVPHFVSYIRQSDNLFRFFNVDDNLEDTVMTMSQFGSEHLLRGTVILLSLPLR
ncbi:MAG: hypothetical protein K6C08_08060 [Oscillospiraceae bacterium]|nr:hypothetical protein [Oscillospiraceae bacterium]